MRSLEEVTLAAGEDHTGEVRQDGVERNRESQADGVLIDLFDGHRLATRREPAGDVRGDIGVEDHILPVEHNIIRVERIPITPLHAFTQEDRELRAVFVKLPTLAMLGTTVLPSRARLNSDLNVVKFEAG